MTEVMHTNPHDLEQIFALFDYSVAYQEKNGYPVWRNYDKQAIIHDVEQKINTRLWLMPPWPWYSAFATPIK